MTQERLRFSINDDLVLMREVISTNPYKDINLWKEVHKNTVVVTRKNFSLRAIKDHMDHLLKLWQKADTKNLRKAGREEQYEEKEELLQSISDMAKLFKSRRESVGSGKYDVGRRELDATDATLSHNVKLEVDVSNESVGDVGLMLTDGASNTLNMSDEPGPSTSFQNSDQVIIQSCQQTYTPESSVLSTDHQQHLPNQVKKRCRESILKNSSLQFLYDKHESDNELKKKQLEVEERKLCIEEKKVELEERRISLEESKWKMEESEKQAKINIEIAEREQKLAMELEERRQRLKQAEQQQKLMELMFEVITKK